VARDDKARLGFTATAGTAVLLAALAWLVPWGEVGALWASVDTGWVWAVAAATVAGHLIAAVRLKAMLPGHRIAVLRDGLTLNLAHGAAMLLLPARLGELVFLGLLRRDLGLSTGGAAVLIVAQRLQDLVAVAAFLALSLLLKAAGLPEGVPVVLAGGATAVLAAALAAVLAMAPALKLAERLLRGRPGRLARGLTALVLQARRAVGRGGPVAPRPMLLTLVFWATEMAALHAALRAFGHTADLASSLFLGSGLSLVFALPIQTVGGLGLGEGGLAALLMLDGMGREAALTLGVSARLLLLAVPLGLALALLAPLWPWYARGRR